MILSSLLVLGFAGPLGQDDAEGVAFFERKIRPVLASRCYPCHSLEAEKVKGGFLLDSREAMLKGGHSGPAIVPGDPDRSPLIKAIRATDEDTRMPPKGRLLAPEEVADFEGWVRRGAPDPRKRDVRAVEARKVLDLGEARKFWSFRPLSDPAVPGPGDVHPVDAFLSARMAEKSVVPAGPADRRTLLRRATLDLTGLPPAPEEAEAFLADPSDDAFARVVDRLLASPRYGERWGRHWLDLVRYADTAGDSSDFPIPQARRYRDYVIDAFNRDKPYDQFVREQIAGDLLPASSDADRYEKIVATGYIAIARRFGIRPESAHPLTIEDTVDNLGRTFLGLGLSCARCHDHKFDPIPTEDYYALYGIFQSTRYPYPGSETTKYQKDFVPLMPAPEVDAILRPFRERLGALEAELRRLEEESKKGNKESQEALKKARKDRDAFAMTPPALETAYAVSEDAPRNAHVHIKGDPDKPGPEVPRRFLQVLGGQALPPESKGSGRRELAEWLTDPSNPLASRVLVNRVWQHHFGKGLVATPNDFGKQGRPPTHPELLDWLARRFLEDGGSLKKLHRRILLSEAYRRSSAGPPESAMIDPENALLWRFNRRRLEAEALRDAMLRVSGELDLRPADGHPFPAPARWDYSQAKPFAADYASFDHSRRTVYWMSQRLRKRPFMEIFDGPDPNSSTPVRTSSTTPLQSLFMMNDRFSHDRAQKFAARLIAAQPFDPAQGKPEDARRIDLAWQLALGRPPTTEEARDCEAYLLRYRERAAGQAEDRNLQAWASVARMLFGSSEFQFLP